MNTTNKRSLSGLSTGYFNYLDVEGNMIIRGGSLSANQDISSSTFLGEPNTYFTGLVSNIQNQLNLLTTISGASFSSTISGGINVYSYFQPQINTLSGYVYLHSNQLRTLSGVINTISNFIPYYSDTYIQPQINLHGYMFTTISQQIWLNTNHIAGNYIYITNIIDAVNELYAKTDTISGSLPYLSSSIINTIQPQLLTSLINAF